MMMISMVNDEALCYQLFKKKKKTKKTGLQSCYFIIQMSPLTLYLNKQRTTLTIINIYELNCIYFLNYKMAHITVHPQITIHTSALTHAQKTPGSVANNVASDLASRPQLS